MRKTRILHPAFLRFPAGRGRWERSFSMEKLFNNVTRSGVMSLILGILSLVLGITVGVLSIINGAILLKDRLKITF